MHGPSNPETRLRRSGPKALSDTTVLDNAGDHFTNIHQIRRSFTGRGGNGQRDAVRSPKRKDRAPAGRGASVFDHSTLRAQATSQGWWGAYFSLGHSFTPLPIATPAPLAHLERKGLPDTRKVGSCFACRSCHAWPATCAEVRRPGQVRADRKGSNASTLSVYSPSLDGRPSSGASMPRGAGTCKEADTHASGPAADGATSVTEAVAGGRQADPALPAAKPASAAGLCTPRYGLPLQVRNRRALQCISAAGCSSPRPCW
jgi:hypothetical protein